MSIGSIIYRILIGPLELFFEVVFELADRHVSNPAYAIIMLSLAMNFLVLPLYSRADAVRMPSDLFTTLSRVLSSASGDLYTAV